jgi:hypothetical protein
MFSWAGEEDFLADFPFLIVAGIGTRLTGESDADTARMDKVSVAALPAPVDKTGPFKVGDQLAELSGHASIKTIPDWVASGKTTGPPGSAGQGGRGHFHDPTP